MAAEDQSGETFSTTVEFGLVASPAKFTVSADGIHIFVSRLLSGVQSLRSDYDIPRTSIRRVYRRPNIMGLPCIWIDYKNNGYEETLYVHPPDIHALMDAMIHMGYSVDAF